MQDETCYLYKDYYIQPPEGGEVQIIYRTNIYIPTYLYKYILIYNFNYVKQPFHL